MILILLRINYFSMGIIMRNVIKRIFILVMTLLLFFMIWKGLRYVLVDDGDSYTRITMHEYYSQDAIDVRWS